MSFARPRDVADAHETPKRPVSPQSDPSASGDWSIRTRKTLILVIGLNATCETLFAKFGKVPATLNIAPTYSGYTLAALTAKITFKR